MKQEPQITKGMLRLLDKILTRYQISSTDTWPLKEWLPVEPQTATCPDCGHKWEYHDGFGCIAPARFCSCKKLPADLQPENFYEWTPEKLAGEQGIKDAEESLAKMQPTQMPLRELSDIDKELLADIKGHVTFQCGCSTFSTTCKACEHTARDIMHSVLVRDKANDSAIAAQAVKTLLDKIEEVGDLPHDWNENGHSQECRMCKLVKEISWKPAHIRAMAEKEG